MNFEMKENYSCFNYYPHNSTMLPEIDQELLQLTEMPYQHFRNGLLKKRGTTTRRTFDVDHILLIKKHSLKKTTSPVPDLYSPRFYEEFIRFHNDAETFRPVSHC
ncbi:hypothetical protein HHI36_016733 [Cryptolaemus montrouzieri]|uniref:Uncharacterized protein n=1 Tax=Cryptolaemus montrouzieri TaxID=559131 RepID=A0ABD2NKY2_9CUCU